MFILSGFLFGRNENFINQADRVRVRVKKPYNILHNNNTGLPLWCGLVTGNIAESEKGSPSVVV